MTAEDNRLINWQEDISYLINRMEAMHPNLYANIARETFMEYVDQLMQRIPSTSDVEMILGIQELVARIRNTHTVMTPMLYMNIPDALKRQFEYYPVYYYPFNDGLYVIYTPVKYKNILGRKVIKIGNLTAENAMKELSRFIAADNEMTALGSIPRFCLNDGQLLHYIGAGDSHQKITLTLANNEGEPFECELATVPYSELNSSPMHSMRTGSKNPIPLYMKQQSENYWFEYLPAPEAVYLQINLIK